MFFVSLLFVLLRYLILTENPEIQVGVTYFVFFISDVTDVIQDKQHLLGFQNSEPKILAMSPRWREIIFGGKLNIYKKATSTVVSF